MQYHHSEDVVGYILATLYMVVITIDRFPLLLHICDITVN